VDYIQQFLEYTKLYESPTEFFYWAILTGIAATLRDNAYLLLGDSRFYPNLYTLIIAKPAMRKAKPLNSTIELMKHVSNTKIIEGRTSIQAVIQRLGETERMKNGITIAGASGFIFSEEISAMFTDDDANIPVLTDLYDYKSSYTSSLVSRGTTRLTNVVVSLLGASNEELLKPIFNSRAIYGGLLSRCLIVYGDKVRHRNSLMFMDGVKFDPSGLQKSLQAISTLRGYFKLNLEAAQWYDQWYNEVCPTLEKSAGVTGAEGRIHVNVLKVAMCLAVSRTCKLTVELEDVQKAIADVQSLFINYRRLTLGSGKSKDADPQATVLEALWKTQGYKLTRNELMAKIWADVSDETLDSVLRTLVTAGVLAMTGGDAQYIELTPKTIEFFTANSK
jgi:hypothetical protein